MDLGAHPSNRRAFPCICLTIRTYTREQMLVLTIYGWGRNATRKYAARVFARIAFAPRIVMTKTANMRMRACDVALIYVHTPNVDTVTKSTIAKIIAKLDNSSKKKSHPVADRRIYLKNTTVDMNHHDTNKRIIIFCHLRSYVISYAIVLKIESAYILGV